MVRLKRLLFSMDSRNAKRMGITKPMVRFSAPITSVLRSARGNSSLVKSSMKFSNQIQSEPK